VANGKRIAEWGGGKNPREVIDANINHEAVAGSGGPFWASDQTMEPQNELLHLHSQKRNLHHRSSKDPEHV